MLSDREHRYNIRRADALAAMAAANEERQRQAEQLVAERRRAEAMALGRAFATRADRLRKWQAEESRAERLALAERQAAVTDWALRPEALRRLR